ncbi:MAG: hypothetical protein AB8B50_04485 [Pirellulaceae bacterium]
MAQRAGVELFSPDEVACVHVMNRAVRRCFLMGDDPARLGHVRLYKEALIE